MTARPTKKSVIRQYLQQARPARIGTEEALAIRRELARVLGPQARISQEYLLDVLAELGASMDAELGGISREVLELLHFDTLAAAETTLRALDERYRTCRSRNERAPAEECRRGAIRVRRRATLIARNRKVAADKRAEKEEIAQWFTIWLQTPELFFDWLALRKQSEDFSNRFGPPLSDHPVSDHMDRG